MFEDNNKIENPYAFDMSGLSISQIGLSNDQTGKYGTQNCGQNGGAFQTLLDRPIAQGAPHILAMCQQNSGNIIFRVWG